MKWDRKIKIRAFVCVLSLAFLVLLGMGVRFVIKDLIIGPDAPPPVTKREQFLTSVYRFSKNVFPSPELNAISLRLGVEYVKKKQYGPARRIFEEVLALEPTNPSILNNLAFIAGEENDLPKAAEYLRTAVQIASNCAECFNNLGSVLARMNKVDEAKQMYESSAKLDAKYIDPRLNLAMLMEEKGDWTVALEMYRQAEPHIGDSELKKLVTQRSGWMAEIAQNSKRNVAQEK